LKVNADLGNPGGNKLKREVFNKKIDGRRKLKGIGFY